MKAPKAPRACKFHRNGDVTIWSVFTQDRQRIKSHHLFAAAYVMSSLPEPDRARIEKAAAAAVAALVAAQAEAAR